MPAKSERSYHSKIEVLNRLLAIQSVIHVFPDEKKLGDFSVEFLKTIPGIKGSAMCLRNCTSVAGIPESEISTIKESLKNISEEQNHFSIDIPKKDNSIVISIQTIERSYGYFILLIGNTINFKKYKPAINNLSNIIALHLENFRQITQLSKKQLKLEEIIKKNTKEIIKRKKAEQESKESEERYKGIVKSTSSCIAVYEAVDKGTNFVFVDFNEKAEKVENISKEKVIGKKVTEVFSGILDFGLFDVFQKVWKTGKPQHFPISVYEDNRIKGYRENYVYKLSSGEIVAVYNDLTEQKRVEENIAKSEFKFRLLASNTYDWEYWIDQNGKYVFISDSCEEISGYNAADFYNNQELLFNLVHPDYTEMVKEHYHSENDKQTPKCNMKFPIINRNGDLRWIEHNCTPVFDEEGNFKGRRGNNRDITEFRKKTDALIQSEENLRVAQRLAHLGSWKWVIATDHVEWSEELYHINGRDPNSPAPSFVEMSACYTPESWERLSKTVGKAMQHGTPYELELDIIRTDGVIRNTFSRGVIVLDENDKIIGLQGTVQDITASKQAEEKIKKAHKQLEELYQYQDGIKENERKVISREIHDELGQSLTALKIDLGWTKDNIEKNSDVEEKIGGMIDIVSNTIKTVQRISSDLRPGLLDDLGLAPAMEWYCQEFEKRTAIKCQLALEDIQLFEEKKNLAIYRILQEALTNVIRHANAKNVSINFYRKEDSIILKIIDDGIGVKAEKIRSSKSLGLIGITERVKQYNGSFDISSEHDKGTELSVVIPFK